MHHMTMIDHQLRQNTKIVQAYNQHIFRMVMMDIVTINCIPSSLIINN